MLWEIGDANMSDLVNGSDNTQMTSILKKASNPVDGVTGQTVGLYYYRILDINMSGLFNGSDDTTLTSILKKSRPKFRIYRKLV